MIERPDRAGREVVLAEIKKGRAVPACLFAWLFPGAGHIYLGRRSKGLVLSAAVTALFALGVVLQARLAVHLGFDDILASLFSVAQMATGLPYLIVRALGFKAGAPTAVTFEYGNTFTAVAGLLNILLILDVYDIVVGRKS
jgi:hypothetical protein